MIHLADKNVLLDDGEGYIDLGLDNLLDWDDKDRMVANTRSIPRPVSWC